MMAAADTSLLDDRALADAARRGDLAAFEELHRRHAPTTWRFAVAVCGARALAAGATVSAFASTLAGSKAADDVPVNVQLLSSARHAAFDPGLQAVAVELRDGPASSTVSDAFNSLPERWRSALWLAAAERLPTHEVGPALGVPAASVGPLTMRAHAGLADKVIGVYAASADDDACRKAAAALLAYSTDRLSPREAAKVRRHLDGCERCQHLLGDLDDLTPSLRLLALPLPAGLLATSESRWRASLVRTSGPLGLTLPNGQPVPPWAERAVAGAAAAVVALGISAAVLVAGRGGRVRDDGLTRSVTAEAPLGGADGENALGGSVGLDGGPASPAPTLADNAPHLGPMVRSADPAPSAPPASVSPAVITPAPVAPPSAEPTPAPAPPAEPAAEVTVGVDDVLGVTVGDQCTGIEIAGTVIGCAPETTDEPVEVITGGTLLDSLGL
jgi:DNA-directed RNA polymerase specialized sigma24 family protein